jgi:hypothetical protein
MVHSTNVRTFGLSMNNKKKDGFLRLVVFTIVKIMSTDKEIDTIYWYWLVGILVGILSTKEFGGNSLNSSTAIRFRREQKTPAP